MAKATRGPGRLAVWLVGVLGLALAGCGVWQRAADAVAAAGGNASAADVTAVSVSGAPGAYTFSVTVSSPDIGCERYADWWEVLDAEGELLYRRVLLHSHVNEQPFTRSGGPVGISTEQVVWVRAHMFPDGYGSVWFTGSAGAGFGAGTPPDGLGAGAETRAPLPDGCAF